METDGKTPELAQLAARQVREILARVEAGSPMVVDSTSDLCSTLELFLPSVLRQQHPEWEWESLDGFEFARTCKCQDGAADFAGTCILISDQTVTPFALRLALSDGGGFSEVRIRLGEAGGGELGISGPPWNSNAADQLLHNLNGRLQQVEWVYDVTSS